MRFGARRPRRLLLHGPPTDRGEPPAAGLEDLRRRERQRICLLRPNPPEGRASAVKNPRSRMRPAALRHQLRYRRPPPKRRPSGHELTGPAGADAPPQPGVRLTSPSLRGPGGDTPRPSPRKSIRVCVRCGYPAPVRAAHVHDESANICASEKTAAAPEPTKRYAWCVTKRCAWACHERCAWGVTKRCTLACDGCALTKPVYITNGEEPRCQKRQ